MPAALERAAGAEQANRRRMWELCGAAGLVVGMLAGVLAGVLGSPLAGALAGVVVAGVVALGVRYGATGLTLAVLGARRVDVEDHPEVANVLEGLCATFGLTMPGVALVDEARPNACAVGCDPRGAVVVLTTGLVGSFDVIGLEAVLAHELVHVKRADNARASAALVVVGPLALLTRRDGMLHSAMGRGREYRADEEAARTVRYPPALRDALGVMARSEAPVGPGSPFGGIRGLLSRWLWIDPMVGHRGPGHELGEIDATGVRAEALALW